jgi:hypothetical protein
VFKNSVAFVNGFNGVIARDEPKQQLSLVLRSTVLYCSLIKNCKYFSKLSFNKKQKWFLLFIPHVADSDALFL